MLLAARPLKDSPRRPRNASNPSRPSPSAAAIGAPQRTKRRRQDWSNRPVRTDKLPDYDVRGVNYSSGAGGSSSASSHSAPLVRNTKATATAERNRAVSECDFEVAALRRLAFLTILLVDSSG